MPFERTLTEREKNFVNHEWIERKQKALKKVLIRNDRHPHEYPNDMKISQNVPLKSNPLFVHRHLVTPITITNWKKGNQNKWE